ncbi:SDR family oxidoreductase [Dactylosporangium roseum]|uniref:SDR family oxidoreductase n=2 Tax=Dactylosporangium roseum TaxID=47989 RepID=A0ABY5YYL6_9ACTN|nr:SDR family oxidoreductase [Dactylosporangium roseum]UWZ34486.1 SDR family oxidoreductase [Dactylosporangium roseum]
MGRAVAERLADDGAEVYVTDLDGAAAQEVADAIRAKQGRAHAVALDVTDLESLRGVFGSIRETHGKLHILHNHVGIPGAGGLTEVTEDQFALAVDVNMKSAWFGTSLAWDLLQNADGRASVIYTASTSAIVGSPFSPLYSFTKGALPSLARSIALAGAAVGIRANTICPGPTDTPMLSGFFNRSGTDDVDAKVAAFLKGVPAGRLATAEDVAGVVSFLASDDASFVTGATVAIDGGLTIS